MSDPRGHMHGHAVEEANPLDPEHWQHNEIYLYAVDLFNHGFYWEAHEAWESLWHAAGHRGQIADFLKGLIKLAAAEVKRCEGNSAGVERHLQRGQELLRSINTRTFCGIDLWELVASAAKSLKENRITLSLCS